MTVAQIFQGLAAAVVIGLVGVVVGMLFETLSALVNKDRRTHIRERGFWGSARRMLS